MPELAPPISVSAVQWQIIQDILIKVAPKIEVWAFGSRAKFTAKPYSDLDLVFLGGHPLTLNQMADLSNAFVDSDLPFKVDVVDWSTISQEFKNIILEHYVPIQKN
jgi:predicted nucleotidyltransferase